MKPYYQDERSGITIFHGDYRDVLSQYPLDSFKHCLTDIPYDEETHANAKRNGKHGKIDIVYNLVDFQSWTFAQATEHFATIAPYVTDWTISFADWRHISKWFEVDEKGKLVHPIPGLKPIRFGIWLKPNAMPQVTGDRPSQGWEGIGMFHRDRKGKMVWNGGGNCATYVYNIARGNRAVSKHRTTKPTDLVGKLMLQFTNPGDLLFEPCMGGGTMPVVAKRLGRRMVCAELEERWCEAAATALQQEVMFTADAFEAKAEQDTMPVAV